jgi:hypothetical protein
VAWTDRLLHTPAAVLSVSVCWGAAVATAARHLQSVNQLLQVFALAASGSSMVLFYVQRTCTVQYALLRLCTCMRLQDRALSGQ